MSQTTPPYKRLKALLSDAQPANPDPAPGLVNPEAQALHARIRELEEQLMRQAGTDNRQAEFQPGKPEAGQTRDDVRTSQRPWYSGLFTAPVFEHDAEKTRSARLLYQITVVSWFLPVLAFAVGILNPAIGRFVMPAGFTLIVVLGLIMALNRAGRVKLGSYLIVGTLLAVFTNLNYSGGAEPRPLTILAVVAIMVSGLLLGSRGPIVVALLLAAQHVIILALAARGIIVPQAGATLPLQNAVVTTAAYLLIGFLLQLAISRIQFAVNQLRARETELEISNRGLKELSTSLEHRVADRTHDLELASEVGRTVTQKVTNLNELLAAAVESIRTRFALYYTQVYLVDPTGKTISLRAGTGGVGGELLARGHRLLINENSLNGRAVLQKRPVVVEDARGDPAFLPNPLLPDTRSEMSLPLVVGDHVVGVLDMQSDRTGALNAYNLTAFEALGGQLAVAIQNAELFAEAEQARAEVESQARRLTQTGWSDYLNAVHKPERIGFVFDQQQIAPLQESGMKIDPEQYSLSAPIEVTGESVGSFTVQLEPGKWTEGTRELVHNVARQVAQQIENLRLLDTAQRYRAEAEMIARRLTHEGWQEYYGSRQPDSLGYAYDLEKVAPLKENGRQEAEPAVTVPLSVRNETIGRLVVDQTFQEGEVKGIVEAVADQLSSHIENLRLSEQNERRAAELETAVKRLRELDRLKSSFLANMSHELRTPLNSILGFADVMLEELDGPLTEHMHNDLSLIQKNGQHLLHLINDVLDMAKIEAGRMNLSPERFRVHEIVEDVTSITSTLASAKNLALTVEPDSDREVEIYADRTRLRQVMINLINNSIKFTEKGSVSIHVARRNEHVVVKVSDTGIGIPADKLEDIFNEFAQVDSSSTRKVGGTGLGLPISRRLIAMHGGRLWAESSGRENMGSTFYIELPLEAQIAESVEEAV